MGCRKQSATPVPDCPQTLILLSSIEGLNLLDLHLDVAAVIGLQHENVADLVLHQSPGQGRQIRDNALGGFTVPGPQDCVVPNLATGRFLNPTFVPILTHEVSTWEKSVPCDRARVLSSSALRRDRMFCISLADLNSWFSRKS